MMVVAFGSRPFDVRANDSSLLQHVPAGVRATPAGDGEARSLPSGPPTVGLRAPAAPVVRGTTTYHSGSASSPPADAPSRFVALAAWSSAQIAIARRTPCAACGDGAPYDATAPPKSA
ncbi:MAG TPA: hypothetical protein VM076_11305 [Gemmatimonadaceae bacterium]|nr:hypothetical protein [Gemmatimonadaceae bacterium]